MINFIKDWDSTGIMIGEDGHTLSRPSDVSWLPWVPCISARCKVPFSQEHPKFEVKIMNIARAGKSQNTHTHQDIHTHAHPHPHPHPHTHTHTHAHAHTRTHARTHAHSFAYSLTPAINMSYNS